MLSSHRALLGVLFCDIRGFTAFCETAEPEETIEVLQTYHEEMGKLDHDHGAGVDHRMGDGIMVLFNDPLPCDDPAGDAVRLAVAMRARMAELCSGGSVWAIGLALASASRSVMPRLGWSATRADMTTPRRHSGEPCRAPCATEAEDGEILLSPRARSRWRTRTTPSRPGKFASRAFRTRWKCSDWVEPSTSTDVGKRSNNRFGLSRVLLRRGQALTAVQCILSLLVRHRRLL